jgi:hypothetical protein
LDNSLNYLLGRRQAPQHNAKDDADDCKSVCEAGAEKLGLVSFKEFIVQNRKLVRAMALPDFSLKKIFKK